MSVYRTTLHQPGSIPNRIEELLITIRCSIITDYFSTTLVM